MEEGVGTCRDRQQKKRKKTVEETKESGKGERGREKEVRLRDGKRRRYG